MQTYITSFTQVQMQNLYVNCKILAEQLQYAKSIYIPKTVRRFNKLKHKTEKWMTNELLTQRVRKHIMYVDWKTTPVTCADNELIKLPFQNFEKEKCGMPYRKQKKRYFNIIFTAYKCDNLITWLVVINDTLSRNK